MDNYRIGPLPPPSSLSKLSTDALSSKSGANEEAKLKKAAQAFESYFVYTLLKEMQKTTSEKSMFGKGPEGEIYQHLFQQALADKISTGTNGIGLTKFLMDALQKRPSAGGERPGPVGASENRDGFPLKNTGFVIGNNRSIQIVPTVLGQPLEGNNR